MVATTGFVFSSLLQAAASLSVPSHLQGKAAIGVALPPGPVTTPVSDWQKDGKPAQWAEGYPKHWGTEEAKYTQLVPHQSSLFGPGTVSDDDKFLIQNNNTHTKITNLDTGTVVADLAYPGDDSRITIAPNGEYDLLVTKFRENYVGSDIFHFRLSKEGVPVKDPTKLFGEVSRFDPSPFSTTDRRYTADDASVGLIYDLDDPSYNLTLADHTDDIMSMAFSPDGNYIATAAWDGKGKLWDSKKGSLIGTLGPVTSQSWVTRFSPNSKYVAIGSSRSVNVYTVSDPAAPPIVISGFTDWIRTLQWSPDGKYIAGGSWAQIQVWSVAEGKVVQKWQLEDTTYDEIVDLTWLEGGKRIAYRIQGGLELYDFEANLKYRWGPGEADTWRRGFNVGGTFLLKRKGWIGGFDWDWDHTVRFWKYPAA